MYLSITLHPMISQYDLLNESWGVIPVEWSFIYASKRLAIDWDALFEFENCLASCCLASCN